QAVSLCYSVAGRSRLLQSRFPTSSPPRREGRTTPLRGRGRSGAAYRGTTGCGLSLLQCWFGVFDAHLRLLDLPLPAFSAAAFAFSAARHRRSSAASSAGSVTGTSSNS